MVSARQVYDIIFDIRGQKKPLNNIVIVNGQGEFIHLRSLLVLKKEKQLILYLLSLPGPALPFYLKKIFLGPS